MKNSVKDRCTKAHEYIFLLTKSAKYYYDAEAIKEDSVYPNDNRTARASDKQKRYPTNMIAGIRPRKTAMEAKANGINNYPKRNKRSVWTVATKPFPGAHFAVFPPKLIEPCILAGCPKGGTVLDPFFGRGTTGLVSYKHGRRWKGIDLSPEYCEMAKVGIERETRQMRMFE